MCAACAACVSKGIYVLSFIIAISEISDEEIYYLNSVSPSRCGITTHGTYQLPVKMILLYQVYSVHSLLFILFFCRYGNKIVSFAQLILLHLGESETKPKTNFQPATIGYIYHRTLYPTLYNLAPFIIKWSTSRRKKN